MELGCRVGPQHQFAGQAELPERGVDVHGHPYPLSAAAAIQADRPQAHGQSEVSASGGPCLVVAGPLSGGGQVQPQHVDPAFGQRVGHAVEVAFRPGFAVQVPEGAQHVEGAIRLAGGTEIGHVPQACVGPKTAASQPRVAVTHCLWAEIVAGDLVPGRCELDHQAPRAAARLEQPPDRPPRVPGKTGPQKVELGLRVGTVQQVVVFGVVVDTRPNDFHAAALPALAARSDKSTVWTMGGAV